MKKKQSKNKKKHLKLIGCLSVLVGILSGLVGLLTNSINIIDRWDKGEIVYDYEIFNTKAQRPDLKKGFVPKMEKEDSYIEYKLTKKRGRYYIDYKSSYFDKLNTGDTIELQDALASYKDNAYKYHYYPFYLDFPILQILIRNNRKTSVTLKTIEAVDIKVKELTKFHSLPFFSYNQSDKYYYGTPYGIIDRYNNNELFFANTADYVRFSGYNKEMVRPKIIFTYDRNIKIKNVTVKVAESIKHIKNTKEYTFNKMPIPLDSILITQGVKLDSMINLIKNNYNIYEYYIAKHYESSDVIKHHYFEGKKSNLLDSITTIPINYSFFYEKFIPYMGKYSNVNSEKPLNLNGVALVNAQIETKEGKIKKLKQLIDFSYFPTQKYTFSSGSSHDLRPRLKSPYIISLDAHSKRYQRRTRPEMILHKIDRDSTSMITVELRTNKIGTYSFRLKFRYENDYTEVSDIFHLNYLSHHYLDIFRISPEKRNHY